jgi:hypothetical protein
VPPAPLSAAEPDAPAPLPADTTPIGSPAVAPAAPLGAAMPAAPVPAAPLRPAIAGTPAAPIVVAPVPARFETPDVPARPDPFDPAIEEAMVPAAPNVPAAPGGIELGIGPAVSSALQPATPLNRTIPSAAPLDTTHARMTLSHECRNEAYAVATSYRHASVRSNGVRELAANAGTWRALLCRAGELSC